MSRLTVGRLSLAGLLALVAALALATAASAHRGEHRHDHLLKANLSGAKEVPGPGDADGRGKALVKIKPSEGKVCFALSWRRIAEPPTMAHIHAGTKDVAGDIVVTLFTGTPVERGCVEGLDSTLLRDIKSNPRAYYVNVHNAEFPAGAIRGQLKKSGKHRGRFGRDDDGRHRRHGDHGKGKDKGQRGPHYHH